MLIVLAFAVAIMTIAIMAMILLVATKALDGAILAHLRLNHERVPGAWMKSSELTYVFGGPVYHHVRRLVEIGLVEMYRRPAVPGDDGYWYRWKGPGKDDVIISKLKTF
jgi:hypothetical protein